MGLKEPIITKNPYSFIHSVSPCKDVCPSLHDFQDLISLLLAEIVHKFSSLAWRSRYCDLVNVEYTVLSKFLSILIMSVLILNQITNTHNWNCVFSLIHFDLTIHGMVQVQFLSHCKLILKSDLSWLFLSGLDLIQIDIQSVFVLLGIHTGLLIWLECT